MQITDYNSHIHFYSKEHENFAYTSIELFKESFSWAISGHDQWPGNAIAPRKMLATDPI